MQDSWRRPEGVEAEREAVSPGVDVEHLGGRQGSDWREGTSSKGLCIKEASEERRVTASGKRGRGTEGERRQERGGGSPRLWPFGPGSPEEETVPI